jgi:nicotinamidase-related amidase
MSAVPEPPPLGAFTEEMITANAAIAYSEGEAAMNIVAGRTALLVIDMIDEFVRPGWTPYWVPEATRQVPRIREIRDAFHAAGAPVVYLAYDVSLRGLDFPATETKVPIGAGVDTYAGQILKEVSIWHELEPGPEDLLVLKHSYSGFHGTPLEAVLHSLDASTLVITGTMTNFCCGATAREAFWRGFDVVFGSDCNSTDDPRLHEAELATLRRGFARIMSSSEIVTAVRATQAQQRGPASLVAADGSVV